MGGEADCGNAPDNAARILQTRLYLLPFRVSSLANVECPHTHRDHEEERLVCEISPWAHAMPIISSAPNAQMNLVPTPKPKDYATRIRFRRQTGLGAFGVAFVEESRGVELAWVSVKCRIAADVPGKSREYQLHS